MLGLAWISFNRTRTCAYESHNPWHTVYKSMLFPLRAFNFSTSSTILLSSRRRQGVNFINILHAPFSYKILTPKITKPNLTREKLLNLLSYKKLARKMLMKLTRTHGWSRNRLIKKWRDCFSPMPQAFQGQTSH